MKVYPKNGSAASVMSVIANVLATELERPMRHKKLTVTASADDRSFRSALRRTWPRWLSWFDADAPTFTGEVEVRSYRLPEGDTATGSGVE